MEANPAYHRGYGDSDDNGDNDGDHDWRYHTTITHWSN